MEFHEKLKNMRLQRALTQEALAQALFVSRTAISKWESGRGYPNLESLKAIAQFFSVTIDELLSDQEPAEIKQEKSVSKNRHRITLIFALLDIGAVLFFIAPLFGQKLPGGIRSVSLFALWSIQPYLKAVYFALILCTVLLGMLTLVISSIRRESLVSRCLKLSWCIAAASALLFILSRQPYAGALAVAILLSKTWLLQKQQ